MYVCSSDKYESIAEPRRKTKCSDAEWQSRADQGEFERRLDEHFTVVITVYDAKSPFGNNLSHAVHFEKQEKRLVPRTGKFLRQPFTTNFGLE